MNILPRSGPNGSGFRNADQSVSSRPDNETSGTQPHSSGSCPAEKDSCPAASGTSGTIPANNTETTGSGQRSHDQGGDVQPENLPNVPDNGGVCDGQLPDACRAAAAPDDDGEPVQRQLIVQGVLRLGRMRQPREQFAVYENPELRELLSAFVVPDTVIEADDTALLTFLDLDVHHCATTPTPAELNAHLAAIYPIPDAAWTSHGGGLKLVYIGPYHHGRALAAAFAAPKSFHVELLRRSRHPTSQSTAHQGRNCGPVIFPDTDPAAPFEFRSIGRLTPEQRSEALDQLGMADGERYDHNRCPLDPDADSDALGCVVVLEMGIYCHRCAGHGVAHSRGLAPGFFPFSAIVGDGTTGLDELAEHRVHWTHARFVLEHRYPNLGHRLLEEAYLRALRARWATGDPRVRCVFNGDLDFVWGDGVWLDIYHFGPTKFDNDAADSLPYVQYISRDEDGEVSVHVDRLRRSQVKNRRPRGYPPLRPVRGISFNANGDKSIPIVAPPLPKHEIKLLEDPLPEDDAFRLLEQEFPRLNRTYLKASLSAGICADTRLGQPAMLACTGPSGSGKQQHIRLAASFVGDDAVRLSLADSEEVFFRQIGSAIASGRRFLVFDEFGKTPKVHQKLKPILEIGELVHWRPLYGNGLVETEVRAAFFFPCVRFPDSLTASEEFNRRTRRAHLHLKVGDWQRTSGGDTAAWRDRSAGNALIANSILTHTWRLCHEFNFQFL